VNFFIFIFYFSLVKAAENAPHLCKLREGCLTGIGHGAMVFAAALKYVAKRHLHFQIVKGGSRTMAHLPIVEFSKLMFYIF
jgi:hypothetical protein